MSRRTPTFDVFVGNLPPDANEKNIGKLFVSYGEIAGLVVKESSKAKPPNIKYAFIKFMCEPDAERATKEMNNMEISGTRIICRKSEKDHHRRRDNAAGPKPPDTAETGSNDGNAAMGFVGSPVPDQHTDKEKETAMITHVESPVTVWIQVVNDDNTKKIFNITEQLTSLCPAARILTGQPDTTKVYACNFAEDGMWYRCMVKQSLGTDKYKIQYIDYGNTEEVDQSRLVEIPGCVAGIKGLASKIVLHNTRPKDLSDKKGIQHLRTLTDNQMIQLVRTRPLTDDTGFYGQIFVTGKSVGEAMVQAGFAVARPAMGGGGRTPGPGGDGGGMPGGGMPGAGSPGQFDRASSSPGPMANVGMPVQMHGGGDSGREKDMQLELTKKRRELERMRNEKDAARMEVEYMRSKVKALQEEFSATAARMLEDTLSKRITAVIGLTGRVKQLRDQLPTGRPCLLEEAIELCQSGERVDGTSVASLQAVSSALTVYKATQKEISTCKELGDLNGLIDARNEAKQNLHDKLNLCLAELEKMPLETRSEQLQEVQMKLVNSYIQFRKFHIQDCPSIENLAPGFKTWKNKKDSEFAEIRKSTDSSEEALQSALGQLKERVSVLGSADGKDGDVDLDELMKTYAHALQLEISVTDLEHSKDSSLVATVVASVSRELQTEIAMLENYRGLHCEFTTLRHTITPWLTDKPTLAEMEENRKLLRSLRSKLRHIMADKLDLEEVNSESEEELATIKREEEKIRQQLQAALSKSDSVIADLAKLAESNFPELILQYPELGLDLQLMYGGLVKANREIDHYTHVVSFQPGIDHASFDGRDVMIQEFSVGGDRCSKEEFMKQVVAYNSDTKQIEAVFFSKNERLAYVQSSWPAAEPLTHYVKGNEMTSCATQQICRNLILSVASLHRRIYIHGEINPSTVLIGADFKVTLLHPDFSKPLSDRMKKVYATENGLVFQLPDFQFSTPDSLGTAADLYNLVLIIFWLHCMRCKPTEKLREVRPGRPDLQLPDLDGSLKMLFETVLTGKNATHIQAEMLLDLDYFTKVIAEPVIPAVTEAVNVPDPSEIPAEDTDDSWTTKSSSTGSRVDSPQDQNPQASDAIADAVQDLTLQPSISTWEPTIESKNNSDQTRDPQLDGEIKEALVEDIFSQAASSPFLASDLLKSSKSGNSAGVNVFADASGASFMAPSASGYNGSDGGKVNGNLATDGVAVAENGPDKAGPDSSEITKDGPDQGKPVDLKSLLNAAQAFLSSSGQTGDSPLRNVQPQANKED